MTVMQSVIHTIGQRYDPFARHVLAHVVGGGYAGNTSFTDISQLKTPCVTIGSTVGADEPDAFGRIMLKSPTSPAGVRLNANDARYAAQQGSTFVIDGVATYTTDATRNVVWTVHTPGYNGATYPPENAVAGEYLMLAFGGTQAAPTLQLNVFLRLFDSFYKFYTHRFYALSIPMGPILSGTPIYYHIKINTATGTVAIQANGKSVTQLIGTLKDGVMFPFVGNWTNFPFGQYNITLGGHPNGANSIPKWYSFRWTAADRPYDDRLRSGPWPVLGGVSNWLGDPAGVAGQPGQRLIDPGAAWVVPAGVTSVCAVSVGCSLSIAGADILSATVRDGGGAGGAGGASTKRTEVVYEPVQGAVFGGSSGTVRREISVTTAGAGGGAGGYTGAGGRGMSPTGVQATAGAGGGAGGGSAIGASGGGVGLHGQGTSGQAGAPGQDGSATGRVYGAGIVRMNNGQPGNDLFWRNHIPVQPGQTVLCTYIGQTGQTGAARVIWGAGRSFPNNAGDV